MFRKNNKYNLKSYIDLRCTCYFYANFRRFKMIERIIKFVTRKKNYSDRRLKGLYSNVCGIVGIILNIFLFIIKLIAGLLTNSISIISDAFNNI